MKVRSEGDNRGKGYKGVRGIRGNGIRDKGVRKGGKKG